MIRFALNLIALAVKVGGFVLLGLVTLGILPWPLVAWLGMELVRGAWMFFSLPPVVQGIGVGFAVYVGLAKWFHNAPLKAQLNSAIEKAHQAYEAQKW